MKYNVTKFTHIIKNKKNMRSTGLDGHFCTNLPFLSQNTYPKLQQYLSSTHPNKNSTLAPWAVNFTIEDFVHNSCNNAFTSLSPTTIKVQNKI